MKNIYITRDLFFDKQASLGTCFVFEGQEQLFKSESLERGWVNNQNMISCIPEGVYDVVLEWSPKFRKFLWEIKGVPNRSECKFHVANYWYQLNGCIALGNNRKFIDGDAIMDITSSGNTMNDFHAAMGNDKKARLHVFNILNL
ncbi:hypothetical protein M1M27_gp38 [Cellulophaga phage Ingeline_1]|uniref:DUF5675 domain-containing protein n=1 Tax=Cellulophaga phage Ingeline_1 TaxID=2745674 RepID=A0A8E5EB59_9CAUD|nr:hypothetical protein M1M27_gp38 [Cellulophaga phage Ingeline_1]QQV89999.1 hypothetical protein Ingeline2_13 [Cellulophaga phage Ingeline_2]QQV90049.1 hypothetical protein Ingeline3_13 [Cellulophaga phage Ingeline_3]QQV90099.1 hypothetical protein Ingeline4_13 [Cellulophaga phage Ingeline_4]QQV90149.1 hypothetical protein Ingeline5_13 [Cellulophaga phage Ingeline_5]QQV90198.1 hypothetical protein Ingeline6_13 [Cellulophaga phage Ingeline_6]QQV90248.1 hypothetical protein Ingeline7_13 [Cellu